MENAPNLPCDVQYCTVYDISDLRPSTTYVSRMLLAINYVEKDPCTMELLELLRELGIEPDGNPDEAPKDDAIAA